ncbi:hypothetical protein QNO21_04705 [Microbacterium sp. zg-Y818]|uniref:hypothetical protein n=1 Tax=unclassified Microbacterium TaxID=2609290 RepID=UPI00214C0670|nr:MULTISPECIES: hypothetical protein [unclassified Microbacterium]MCR2800610.1 hypothetical protein [Microbacterium sp. zg.Y818]WIM23336.1 hypothetical protein QNO21_04705 [Microbacterium sp. zg-Y818]
MTTPRNHRPPTEVRERTACMCMLGQRCSVFAPGHAVHLIQARLASATPAEWSDAIVDEVDAAAGTVSLRAVDTGESAIVWSAAGAAHVAEVGTPVALHRRYQVLAVGRRWFNVAPIGGHAE